MLAKFMSHSLKVKRQEQEEKLRMMSIRNITISHTSSIYTDLHYIVPSGEQALIQHSSYE